MVARFFSIDSRKLSLLFMLLFLWGCQTHPTGIIDALTPETVQVGLTAPNLINGPVASTSTQASAQHNPLGQIGITISATYRLKPIKVERAEPQPVRIVSYPTPKP